MASNNIQIGIDLGTTNSEASVNIKGDINIVRNVWQDEYTPSVFGFDKAKNKIVGKKAYEKLFKDGSKDEELNYKSEVKRLMGTSEKVEFPNADVKLNAEEISSEILQSLREDIQRKYPEVFLDAAVITVPAYFSILQKESTKRAGELAGFDHVVLLQEPISAAMSYGFSNNKDENIMVYDFGGGTFDVAVVSSKEGVLSVLNQNGDNFLGGKDIDNAIVDDIVLPKINKKYPDLSLSRAEKKYKNVITRLKYLAEKAKIELTQLERTSIEVDLSDKQMECEDNCIYLNFEMSREELEAIMLPLIERTISLAEKAIKDSGLKKNLISRIVLVGGPTQMPCFKRVLEEKMGIKVDSTSDPLTAVARGAAIFGLSQKIPKSLLEKNKPKEKSLVGIELFYDGLTSDDEQLITGSIDVKDSDGWYLQIQSESGFFNSPKIAITNGKFKSTIKIEQNKSNLYWIYLFDSSGAQVPTSSESITITHGLTVGQAQISHSLGLSIRGIEGLTEEMEFYFRKGDRLPLQSKKTFHTAQRLRKGDETNPLFIRLVEGESKDPKNNEFLAETGIDGKDLPHDIPEGSEIDVTVKLDESNVCTVEWFLPLIEKGGDFRTTIMDEVITVDGLQASLEQCRSKTALIRESCTETEQQLINEKITEIAQSIMNAGADEDEKRKARKGLKELAQGLYELEQSKELPKLEEEFKERVTKVREFIFEIGLEEDKEDDIARLKALEAEGKEAVEARDKVMLSRNIEQLIELGSKVLFSNPQFWKYRFDELRDGNHDFSDPEEAKYYLSKGDKAIEAGDLDGLKSCVMGLSTLLSAAEVESINDKISGIMK